MFYRLNHLVCLLAEIDLAENDLTRVPDCAYNVIQLRRINLSKNLLTEFDVPGQLCRKAKTILRRHGLEATTF